MKQGEKYEKIKKKFEDCNYTLTDIDKENVFGHFSKINLSIFFKKLKGHFQWPFFLQLSVFLFQIFL